MSDAWRKAVAYEKRLLDAHVDAEFALADAVYKFATVHSSLLHDSEEGHELLDALDTSFEAFEEWDNARANRETITAETEGV